MSSELYFEISFRTFKGDNLPDSASLIDGYASYTSHFKSIDHAVADTKSRLVPVGTNKRRYAIKVLEL